MGKPLVCTVKFSKELKAMMDAQIELQKRIKANDRKVFALSGYPAPWNDPVIVEARKLADEMAELQRRIDEEFENCLRDEWQD